MPRQWARETGQGPMRSNTELLASQWRGMAYHWEMESVAAHLGTDGIAPRNSEFGIAEIQLFKQ